MARWCVSHLAQVRAPEMAAALAFRTLFGLIPVFFVATLVTRSLLGEAFPKFVRSLVETVGLGSVSGPTDSSTAEASGAASATTVPLSAWIEELVTFTGTLNLSALGVVGVLIVLASALWLIVTIEETFNVVCRVTNSRPWVKRVVVYWASLTLGPLILAALPLATSELRTLVASSDTLNRGYLLLEPVLAFALLWGLLIFSYSVIPAQRMHLSPVLIGALTGAVGLELGRNFLGFYMERAFTVNRLYGSLGLVPLFMFWVYSMWLIVLFGLQVSSLLNILMNRQTRRIALAGPLRSFDPRLAVMAMEWFSERYRCAQPGHLAGLADAIEIDQSTAKHLIDCLARAGLIIRVGTEGMVLPARPLELIRIEDALAVGYEMSSDGRQSSPGGIVGRLRASQMESVAGLTFAQRPTCQDPSRIAD